MKLPLPEGRGNFFMCCFINNLCEFSTINELFAIINTQIPQFIL